MRTHILLLLGLFFSTFAVAQESDPPVRFGPNLERGSEIGPLVFKSVDPENLWISVAWDPEIPRQARRINDKVPEAFVTPEVLRIQLSYIHPRSSADPAERRWFHGVFLKGIETLLRGARPFRFEVTDDLYAGPGQFGGVFVLDDRSGPTLQLEMVRHGYAVVRPGGSWRRTEKYSDAYRDELLRLEGEARAFRLGVWSPQPERTE